MADKLPLAVYHRIPEPGKLELLVGETEESLESVGIISFYKLGGISYMEYTPLTAKVKSFLIREDNLENSTRELNPMETVQIRLGDTLAWGRYEPEVTVECTAYSPSDKLKQDN